MKTTLIVVLGFLAAPALAQVAPRPAVKKKATPHVAKRTTAAKTPSPQRLDFTKGDLVEAGIDTGTSDVISVRPPPRLSRLIPIRADFLPELIKSAEDL